MAEVTERLSWHSGFCGAMELEFLKYKGLLDFSREFPLIWQEKRVPYILCKVIFCFFLIMIVPQDTIRVFWVPVVLFALATVLIHHRSYSKVQRE